MIILIKVLYKAIRGMGAFENEVMMPTVKAQDIKDMIFIL